MGATIRSRFAAVLFCARWAVRHVQGFGKQGYFRFTAPASGLLVRTIKRGKTNAAVR